MKKGHIRLVLAIYIVSIIVFAAIPLNTESHKTLSHVFVIKVRLDYLLHTILFIPWVILCMLAFNPVKWNEKLLIVVSGLLMALGTEGMQYFLTYRSYNVNDLLANFLGVLLGMGGWIILGKVLKVKSEV